MSSSTNIHKSQRIAMNTFILFIRMFVLTIINLYTVRLVLTGLGVIDYGIFNAVAGVVTTSAFLISILELAIQRFYSISLGKNDQESLNQIFSISLKITIFISIVIFIAFESAGLWFISHKLNIPFERLDAAYYCFHFGLAAFILTLLQIPFSSAVFSHEDMNIYALFSSIDYTLKLFIALLIGKMAMDNLSFYSLGLLIVATITFINYCLYSHYKYAECKYKKVKNPELTKKILFFSGWTMLGSFSKVCMVQGSTILLNIFFGPISNAAFAISMQISNAFNALCNSMVLAVRPAMIKAYSNQSNDYLYKTFNLSNKFILYVLLAVAFPMIANMELIIKIWLHETTPETVLFAQLTIIQIVILAMNNPITIIIQATGKIKEYSINVEGISLLCLPISYLAFYAGLSSAWIYYSMIAVCGLAHIERLRCLKKTYSIFQYKDYIKELCIPASVIIASGIIIEYLIENIPVNATIQALISIICLPLFMISISCIIGLNNKEKNIIKEIVKAKFKTKK